MRKNIITHLLFFFAGLSLFLPKLHADDNSFFLDLSNLEWYIKTGYEANDSNGFDIHSEHVKKVSSFPILPQGIFNYHDNGINIDPIRSNGKYRRRHYKHR